MTFFWTLVMIVGVMFLYLSSGYDDRGYPKPKKKPRPPEPRMDRDQIAADLLAKRKKRA